ncbi:MAG: diguanylate cyclase [Bacillota bacterium]|nr:diguanylate cyclase [Bacillota bacterium]
MRSKTIAIKVKIALLSALFIFIYLIIFDFLLAALFQDAAWLVYWQSQKKWLLIPLAGLLAYLLVSLAIKENIKNERILLVANEKLAAIIAASPLAILILDADNRILSWNTAAEKMFGWTEKEVLGCLNPTVAKNKQLEFLHYLKQTVTTNTNKSMETTLIKKDGTEMDAAVSLASISSKGKVNSIVALISDISEQKKREKQLEYLSLHDALTGIYNRAYFEREMKRLEKGRHKNIGMIICDLDGLKLYNDSMGHSVGDILLKAAAQAIKSCFRESDVVARIGGDEFAVLLPGADLDTVRESCERIQRALNEYNKTHKENYLSVSIGYAAAEGEQINMAELFKEADNNMYKEKMRRGEAVREISMQILLRALAVRDYVSGDHYKRIEELAATLANRKGLKSNHLDDIRLLAKFRDLGKIAIPESILFKKEPLTKQEKEQIRRHPEIGKRIAQTVPDLVHLADWILKHHEWWNGGGYPMGLKGRDIPLECRILAVVDAYDALTNDRPYRQAKSPEEALAELKKNAGTQFDPELVDIFSEMIMEEKHYQR